MPSSLYRINAVDRPVELDVDRDFVDRVRRLTSGWSITPWTGSSHQQPSVRVTRDNNEYVITSDWLQEPLRYRDNADATCTLFVQLTGAYSESRPDYFLLHAGAVAIDGKLIVLPAAGRIGKSTLSAVLAAHGAAIFSDDALPVSLDRRTGSALGFGPRPRLPLPDSLDQRTRSFIENHIGLGNADFAYLALPSGDKPGELVPRGTEQPIGGFVIPDRIGDTEPATSIELLPASRAETMAQLIGQHLGKQPPSRELVEKLAALVGSVPCWRLRYTHADDAAKFLIAHPPFAAQ